MSLPEYGRRFETPPPNVSVPKEHTSDVGALLVTDFGLRGMAVVS